MMAAPYHTSGLSHRDPLGLSHQGNLSRLPQGKASGSSHRNPSGFSHGILRAQGSVRLLLPPQLHPSRRICACASPSDASWHGGAWKALHKRLLLQTPHPSRRLRACASPSDGSWKPSSPPPPSHAAPPSHATASPHTGASPHTSSSSPSNSPSNSSFNHQGTAAHPPSSANLRPAAGVVSAFGGSVAGADPFRTLSSSPASLVPSGRTQGRLLNQPPTPTSPPSVRGISPPCERGSVIRGPRPPRGMATSQGAVIGSRRRRKNLLHRRRRRASDERGEGGEGEEREGGEDRESGDDGRNACLVYAEEPVKALNKDFQAGGDRDRPNHDALDRAISDHMGDRRPGSPPAAGASWQEAAARSTAALRAGVDLSPGAPGAVGDLDAGASGAGPDLGTETAYAIPIGDAARCLNNGSWASEPGEGGSSDDGADLSNGRAYETATGGASPPMDQGIWAPQLKEAGQSGGGTLPDGNPRGAGAVGSSGRPGTSSGAGVDGRSETNGGTGVSGGTWVKGRAVEGLGTAAGPSGAAVQYEADSRVSGATHPANGAARTVQEPTRTTNRFTSGDSLGSSRGSTAAREGGETGGSHSVEGLGSDGGESVDSDCSDPLARSSGERVSSNGGAWFDSNGGVSSGTDGYRNSGGTAGRDGGESVGSRSGETADGRSGEMGGRDGGQNSGRAAGREGGETVGSGLDETASTDSGGASDAENWAAGKGAEPVHAFVSGERDVVGFRRGSIGVVRVYDSPLRMLANTYVATLRLPPALFGLAIFAAPIVLSLLFTSLYLLDLGGLHLEDSASAFFRLLKGGANGAAKGSSMGDVAAAALTLDMGARDPYLVFELFIFSLSLATGLEPSISPSSVYTQSIANLNALSAQLLFVFLSGAVFTRLSQPSDPISSASVAVITPPLHDPVLNPSTRSSNSSNTSSRCRMLLMRYMIVGLDPCHLVDVRIQVTLLYDSHTHSGSFFRVKETLQLVKDEDFSQMYGFVVRHVIDRSSPLYGRTQEDLEAVDASLVLCVLGIEESSMQTVCHTDFYNFHDGDVKWDAEFEDVLLETDSGRRFVDERRLSRWRHATGH